MLNYHVKVGLVPVRRDVTPRPGIFNWEKAEERCHRVMAYIEDHFADEHVSFVDLKGINEVDVLYNEKDVDAVIKRFQDNKVDAVSAECWTAMQLLVGAMPRTAYGILADMGYIIGCESDMHATITQVLLSSAVLGERKPFLGEFTTRHPKDRDIELLWHCGPFAHSMKKEGSPCKCVNIRQWFQVQDGHYTIARMDQDRGNYSILVGECDSAEGPYTFGTYLWAKFNNLPAWERKLVEGPYIHHMSEMEGAYTEVFREFCKYIPDLSFDTVE